MFPSFYIESSERQAPFLPKICLNMIVKNESRVILRLLESVVNLIDGYCICDTGSSDDTIALMTDFFVKHGKPGKFVEEPFLNFGYNRTYALASARQLMPSMDYVLLLDADMVLTGSVLSTQDTIENFKQSLKKDVYVVAQGSPSFFYNNVRMLRNVDGYSYWGVTHEYVNRPSNSTSEDIALDALFINDVGDGGSKLDKFQRDIRLLEKGLEENPDNDRYTFYLANSYRDAGEPMKAIETFKKRIAIGGWIEEIWMSYLCIGRCYKSMGDSKSAIYWWLEGYQAYPKRIENLYEIIHLYRVEGKNHLAYSLYVIADKMRKIHNTPVNIQHLFLEKDVYDYKLDYELSIVGYYVNYENFDLKKVSMKVLTDSKTDASTCKNVLSNYKFYTDGIGLLPFPSKFSILLSVGKSVEPLFNSNNEYVKSTPSILLHRCTFACKEPLLGAVMSPEGQGDADCAFKTRNDVKENHLYVVQRYVNYRIDDKGGYINKDKVRTVNVFATIDISVSTSWKIVDEFILKYNTESDTINPDNYYEGLEDVRIYLSNMSGTETIKYNANRGLGPNNMKVEHGTIDISTQKTVSNIIMQKGWHCRDTEKNWVMFSNKYDKEYCIYEWFPLTIGEFVENHFVETSSDTSVPPFFKHIRGSTNGVRIGDELWFICHCVSYEDRRYYYHLWTIIDIYTHKVKKFSPFFTFEKQAVEYTLGFVYMEETSTFLIGYSLMDRETKYMEIKKEDVDKDFLSII